MTSSFLKDVAKEIVFKSKDFKNLILVLPSRRSGIFLKSELLNIITKTTYAPEIYSIEEFIEKLARIKLVGNIQLLFEFYEVYKKETPSKDLDSFYHFSKWAQTILHDFNEIDRYLIDPHQIFTYLSSIKELNHWYLQKEKTALQQQYIKFWNHLKTYYLHFRERLLRKKIGYQGLVYREAYKNTNVYLKEHPEKHHIFIGFNALNKAEEKLIQEFLTVPNNDILWDIDETFLLDEDHAAGLFIRTYKKSWNFFKTKPLKITSNHFKHPKNINIIGIPKAVGQAKYIGGLIQDINKNKAAITNTAVILGNETLLTPLLNALPKDIRSVNITCGMPLYQTPIASFFNHVFHLIENEKENTWYYTYVIALCTHAVTQKLLDKEKDHTRRIIHHIQHKNTIFVSLEDIKAHVPKALHEIIARIFISTAQMTINTIIQKCIDLTYLLKEEYDHSPIYLEYLYKCYTIFNQMLHLNTHYNSISNITALKSIYQGLLREETVHFKGEPLEGLQIMGMLESRNLDFETIIISAVNEGILPSGKNNSSFFSYDIKNTFQLPTYKEKDAIYTYHFYRLLQRAKHIYLLYNTEPDALEGNEKSRFLLQLITHKQANHTIKEIIARPKVTYTPYTSITIKKSPSVIEQLKHISKEGFSPTSLSNYIRNPIDFYHNTILNIKTENELEENITARTLGIIIHNTLEALYKPLEGKWLTEANLLKMKEDAEAIIFQNFMTMYQEAYFSKGKNLISHHIVKRYIQHFLEIEQDRLKNKDRIQILHIEKSFTTPIYIPELALTVHLKGTIDRVEQVNNTLTIIDYKTGKVIPSDIEIVAGEHLLDSTYHKAFQLLSYTYLYTKNHEIKTPVEAMILSFRNFKGGYLKFSTKNKPGGHAQKFTTIGAETINTYENTLKSLLLEIFDPNLPFIEKALK